MGAPVILGANSVVRLNNTVYWAEGGLIQWRDESTGKLGSITIRDALLRIKGLNDMIGNRHSSEGSVTAYADRERELRASVDGLVRLCEQAKQQGDPDDPATRAQRMDAFRAKQKSRHVFTRM